MTTINRQQNNVVVSDSWSYSYCGYKTMPCDNALSAVIFNFLLGGYNCSKVADKPCWNVEVA
jgi:hypothetical protein